MSRLMIALMCVLALALTACEQDQVTETPQVEEGSTATQPLADTEQETAMQEPPPAATQEQDQATMQEQTASQEPSSQDQQMQQPSDQQMAAQQPSDQQQEGATAAPSDSQEHMGQSPEFGDAPENITLEAKNGNVEFSHKAHADMTECKTCHGAAEPGPIEGWDKNMAHDLCKDCHQQEGAGPTKCTECHKK